MSKLQRSPISIKKSKSDSILDFPKAEIKVGNKYYDLSDLDALDNFYEIVSGIKAYLQGRRSPRKPFLVLRNFLIIISKFSSKIDERTMILYKNQLDANPNITLSTKWQKYSTVCNFAKYIISKDIIDDFIIPPNFENIEKKPIPSFGDIARNYIENDRNFNKLDIEEITNFFSLASLEAKTLIYCLASLEAKTLIYCLASIDLIHDKAINDIYRWEKDWDKVQEIIENINKFNLEKIIKVNDFNNDFIIPERTLSEALQILYSKFGNNIPAVKYWPKGMEDFFRSINWKSSRVKNLFKGIENNIGDLELLNEAISNLSLSNETKFKEVKDYYFNSEGRDPRSIELALTILFVRYGRILPDSTQWPKGIVDYLKHRGWIPNRVRAAFFPHPDTLAPFIVGLLSHPELAPNVDSVAFYCYLSSFQLSTEEGRVKVYLEKFRGKPLYRDIKASDPMISCCMRHTHRMLNVLNSLENRDEVRAIMAEKKIPLFLQFTPSNNKYVRILDPSTLVNIIKRFLVDLATEQPSILPLVQGSCTGQNFRPTIALIERLSGTSLLSIQKLLNHAHSTTTTIYTERVHTHSILLNKSKEFQHYLVDNALNEGIESRNEAENKEFDEPADQWLNCEAKRIWFKDHEIIAEWIAWEQAIRESEEELKFDNIVRWENYWLPRLVRFQSLIATVLEVDKRHALELAKHIKLPPLS